MKPGIRSTNFLLVVIAVSLVVGVGLYDLTRNRLAEGSYIRDRNGKLILTFLPKQQMGTLPGLSTSSRARFTPGTTVQPDDLWALYGKPGKWVLASWRYEYDGYRGFAVGKYRKKGRMRSDYAGDIGRFELDTWGGTDPNLFFFGESGDRITVNRMPLRSGASAGQVQVEGRTPRLGRLPDSSVRSLSMAAYSGSLPDLYVIDSKSNDTWDVAVYSGESGFRKLLGTFITDRIKSGEIRQKDWIAGIMERPSGKPDLGLVTDSVFNGSSHTELHFGTGKSGFKDFPLRIATNRWGAHVPGRQLFLIPLSDAGYDDLAIGGVLDVYPRKGEYRVLRITSRH